jgi:hypothetical protein
LTKETNVDHVIDASKSENFNLDQFIAQQRRTIGNRSDLEPYCILANSAGSFAPPEKFREYYEYRPYPKVVQTPHGPVVMETEEEHNALIDALAAAEAARVEAERVAAEAAANSDPEAERAALLAKLKEAGKTGLGNASIETLRKRVAELGAGE